MERSAGMLLPIFSLPGDYGAGVLGAEAREFVDFLHAAGQKWWQILLGLLEKLAVAQKQLGERFVAVVFLEIILALDFREAIESSGEHK